MKIVIAPDSFKGSLTAVDAARAIEAGVRRVFPDASLVSIPLADGGEGTVDAWLRACGGYPFPTRHSPGGLRFRTVAGPLGEPVRASFGVLADATAVVETAAACGLTLVPIHRRNPLDTTTYGAGELIRAALEGGAPRVIVGLGGSATNDGGSGALQALGVRFLDENGRELNGFMTGASLESIATVDAGQALGAMGVEIVLASDVVNPLCGPNGASAVYGPQKGATPEMVARLDSALAAYAGVLKRDMGVDIVDTPGAGAAGGLGAALMALFEARAQSGIDLLLDAANFDLDIVDADYVVTGEGSIDRQTLSGKAVAGVVARCRRVGSARVIAIGGVVEDGIVDTLMAAGIDHVEQASMPGMPREESMARAAELVADAAERALNQVAG